MDSNSTWANKKENNKTSIRENAINKREVDGQDINHQVKDKRENHQPRDNA